jgi:mono/diheme cytochrome c family protein
MKTTKAAALCAGTFLSVALLSQGASSIRESPPFAAIAAGAMSGNAANGKNIFSQNCASCHGASGTEGGTGPSLKGEKSKKNFSATVAWIKKPEPPMPKLYPSPLNAQQVNDVAAYVQSL